MENWLGCRVAAIRMQPFVLLELYRGWPPRSTVLGDGLLCSARTLRANKSETFDCLKFTLEGEGDRTHGNAFTDAAFTGCRI
jgi:hypothetical protein